MNRTIASAALATAVLVGSSAAASDPVLHQIGSVDDLKAAFNSDHGVPRVVLLLSPT